MNQAYLMVKSKLKACHFQRLSNRVIVDLLPGYENKIEKLLGRKDDVEKIALKKVISENIKTNGNSR